MDFADALSYLKHPNSYQFPETYLEAILIVAGQARRLEVPVYVRRDPEHMPGEANFWAEVSRMTEKASADGMWRIIEPDSPRISPLLDDRDPIRIGTLSGAILRFRGAPREASIVQAEVRIRPGRNALFRFAEFPFRRRLAINPLETTGITLNHLHELLKAQPGRLLPISFRLFTNGLLIPVFSVSFVDLHNNVVFIKPDDAMEPLDRLDIEEILRLSVYA